MKRNFRPKPCTACHEDFVPNSGAQIHCFKCGRRRCKTCKEVKDTSEFSYNKNTPDKCQTECKDCQREYMRQRRQDPEFKEREREYWRQARGYIPLENRTCERCGDTYDATNGRQMYCKTCIPEVRREYERQRLGYIPLENRQCAECGDTFDAANGNQVYCETCGEEKVREYWRNRSRIRRDERANIPPGLIEWSLKYWDYKCPYCGSELDEYHLDHHFPLTPQEGKLGRPLVPGNIMLLHQTCNLSKGNTDPSEFYPDNILADIQKFLVCQEFLFGFTLDFSDQPRDTSHELL